MAVSIQDRAAFQAGVVAMATPLLGIVIWGTVTGLAMIQAGLDPAQAVGMSLIMYAGSAQLAVYHRLPIERKAEA